MFFSSSSEIISNLERTLAEGRKVSNVDIQVMFQCISRCRFLVQQLIKKEEDPFYKNLVLQLEETLATQINILQAKIEQLNGKKIQVTQGDPQQRVRRSAIEDTIITKGGIRFQDIAGLNDAKEALREAIIIPLLFPHLFTGSIKPWKRILLYGPPGTGKSRLAQAVSSEIKSTFYCVSSSDLVSSWVGESEKLIKELFQHATKQSGRSVVFIDEIDSICRQRSSREEEYTRRIKTELLKQMEGADNADTYDQIFLLCATNCPWELDSAFLRRFQRRIFIPLPDKEARIDLMKIHTKDNKVVMSDEDWTVLGAQTEGYSGSDLANLTLESLFCPIRELQTSKEWKQKDDQFVPCKDGEEPDVKATIVDIPAHKVRPREVTLNDFMAALKTHRKTVTQDEIQKFENFTKSMGEQG
ncbi:uncharacterized protein LOC133198325 [Saccostrea echinata]|uniref:uncharacterized protein LOC133198325 n=1 Tax=Saccostrea echinata TaxID=191078 RepID=UPI002A840868|nr:uncharacterized protein LOC133198325 [Saccostrea echinata]